MPSGSGSPTDWLMVWDAVPRVSLLCDYFVAASDDAAAVTINWDGGPSRPAVGQPGYEVVALGGIEPVVLMGQLEALLTHRSLDEVRTDPGHRPVAIRDDGARLVIPIGVRLEQALVARGNAEIPEVATAWAQVEEFWGQAEPGALADAILQLIALATKAQATSAHVYCWMSI